MWELSKHENIVAIFAEYHELYYLVEEATAKQFALGHGFRIDRSPEKSWPAVILSV